MRDPGAAGLQIAQRFCPSLTSFHRVEKDLPYLNMHRPCGINWSVGLAVSLFFPASDESRPRKLLESQSRPTPLQGGTLLVDSVDFHPKSGIDKHLFGHLTSSSLTYIVREDVDQGLAQNTKGNSRLGWRRSAPARSHLVCCFPAPAPHPSSLGPLTIEQSNH